MSHYLKYSIINGELNLYLTLKQFEKIKSGEAGQAKMIFHIVSKETNNEEKMKKKILAEIDELKELVNNLNH